MGICQTNVPIYISLKCIIIIINLTRLVAKQQSESISYSIVLLPEPYFEINKWKYSKNRKYISYYVLNLCYHNKVYEYVAYAELLTETRLFWYWLYC
jgi:hypothetical protein